MLPELVEPLLGLHRLRSLPRRRWASGNASPGNDVASLARRPADIGAEQIDVLMKIRARTYRFDRAHYETLERVMRVESAENWHQYAARPGGPWARSRRSAGVGWSRRTCGSSRSTWTSARRTRVSGRRLNAAMRETGLIELMWWESRRAPNHEIPRSPARN